MRETIHKMARVFKRAASGTPLERVPNAQRLIKDLARDAPAAQRLNALDAVFTNARRFRTDESVASAVAKTLKHDELEVATRGVNTLRELGDTHVNTHAHKLFDVLARFAHVTMDEKVTLHASALRALLNVQPQRLVRRRAAWERFLTDDRRIVANAAKKLAEKTAGVRAKR